MGRKNQLRKTRGIKSYWKRYECFEFNDDWCEYDDSGGLIKVRGSYARYRKN